MKNQLSGPGLDLATKIATVCEGLATASEIQYLQAKAMHETGFGTSPLYVNGRNAFAMKFPNQRPSTASGTITAEGDPNFATYDTVDNSILDILMYYEYFEQYKPGPTWQDMDAQAPKYATDPLYASKIADIQSTYNWPGSIYDYSINPSGTTDQWSDAGQFSVEGALSTKWVQYLLIGFIAWFLFVKRKAVRPYVRRYNKYRRAPKARKRAKKRRTIARELRKTMGDTRSNYAKRRKSNALHRRTKSGSGNWRKRAHAHHFGRKYRSAAQKRATKKWLRSMGR